MLNDFPCIYPDELLYGILGRYHQTDGYLNIKIALNEMFNRGTIVPILDLPCHLEELCSNLPGDLGYSSDWIIMNCTLFPFYSPFMDEYRRQECIEIMKFKNGSGLKTKMGIVAGEIFKKDFIYFCPECAKAELKNYREAYIHRLHQVPGVFICEKHLCKLNEYKSFSTGRLHFTNLEFDEIEYKTEFIDDNDLNHQLLKITEEVKYLLSPHGSDLDQCSIHQKYLSILDEKGYLTPQKRIKQRKFIADFRNHYGEWFLNIMNSNLDIEDENNWLKILLRKPNRAMHPIRHILLIDFLTGSIDKFTKFQAKSKSYSCLNKFCSEYRKSNKTKYVITADYKTREPIATIICEKCGFKYSRKASKEHNEIGTIKDYGFLWLNMLREILYSSKNKSLRAIAREMGCDSKTVVKYSELLGLRTLVQSNMKVKLPHERTRTSYFKGANYRESITKFVKNNPSSTITVIKRNNYKEYMWLYKNDKEWLNSTLPKPTKPSNIISGRVDWDKRDEELLQILKKQYELIKSSGALIRITKTLLGRKSGKLSYIEKRLDKLPKCNEYLKSVQESVEEYQIRRINVICEMLHEKGEPLVEWRIKKLAGLKSEISPKVQRRINKNIVKNHHMIKFQ